MDKAHPIFAIISEINIFIGDEYYTNGVFLYIEMIEIVYKCDIHYYIDLAKSLLSYAM